MIGLAACLAITAAEANVVTVVSAQSPITSLSKAQVADIFLGKSYRFPDGSQATPIDQPEASGVREEFYDKVTGKSLSQMKAHWSKVIFTGRGRPPKTVSSSAEVKKFLAANLLAIGYIEDTQVDPSVRVLREN
ncbi:MAG: phosphate ABC transporter substrate-binding protein [Gammaproteobacteria bacterium]